MGEGSGSHSNQVASLMCTSMSLIVKWVIFLMQPVTGKDTSTSMNSPMSCHEPTNCQGSTFLQSLPASLPANLHSSRHAMSVVVSPGCRDPVFCDGLPPQPGASHAFKTLLSPSQTRQRRWVQSLGAREWYLTTVFSPHRPGIGKDKVWTGPPAEAGNGQIGSRRGTALAGLR